LNGFFHVLHSSLVSSLIVVSVKVTFIDPDNNRYVVDGLCGESLYETAMRAQVQFKGTHFIF
jgi:hypothetical protein